jgi:hypothetical protein
MEKEQGDWRFRLRLTFKRQRVAVQTMEDYGSDDV